MNGRERSFRREKSSPLPAVARVACLHLYQLEAANWVERTTSVRRRMINHLRLTGMAPEQDEKVIELQLRHSLEVLRTFGAPSSNHNRPMAISTSKSVAMESEVMP